MITDGKFVSVHYTGTLDDGTVFDSSEGRDPLEFETGSESIIPAFEQAIRSMTVNEEKEIKIPAEEAYGSYSEELFQSVPKEDITQYIEPVQGMTIQVMSPEGQHIPATIQEILDTEIVLNFNHPLAGKDLNFKMKLVAVNETAQYAHSCGCGSDDCCGGEEENCGCECGGECN